MALALAALTVFLGGGVLLLACITIYRFMRDWKATPGRPGLLPLHVWTVAVSYMLLVLLILLGVITGYTDATDWRAAIRIPALGLGLVAMFVLVNFQNKTYSHTRRTHARLRDAAEHAADRDPAGPDRG